MKSWEDQNVGMSDNEGIKQAMGSGRPNQENSEHRAKPFWQGVRPRKQRIRNVAQLRSR